MTMINLLLNSLLPNPPAEIDADDEKITQCAKLARRHGVEILFYSQLKKHYQGINAGVDNYLAKTENLHRGNAIRSMRQEGAERKLMALLEKEAISACVIKGNEIARSLYDDPNCRSSADIDVLVKITDVARADKVLKGIGYKRENPLPLAFCVGRLHHASYRSKQNNHLLELHWDFGIPGYFNLSSEEIWKGAIKKNVAGYRLTSEMVILQLFIHHFRHAFRELKILLDILWGLHKYEKVINWHDFALTLHKIGMVKSARIILDQLDCLWQLSECPLESFRILKNQLDSYPLRSSRLFLRYFRIDLQREYVPENTRDIFMAKLVLDSKTNIIYSFTKVMFPRPRDIKALYPNSNKLMLPCNYLRFVFWRMKRLLGFGGK